MIYNEFYIFYKFKTAFDIYQNVLVSCVILLPANLSHNLYAALHSLPVFVIIKSWKTIMIIFQMQ